MSAWPYNLRKWERIRKQKLQRDPCCEACLRVGEVVAAEVVDHIVPMTREGREKRLAAEAFVSLDALASLCVPHHNMKTRCEQIGEDFEEYMRRGCDVFGRPMTGIGTKR
jgi:5-methylcytosine-specific restriction enzyme A